MRIEGGTQPKHVKVCSTTHNVISFVEDDEIHSNVRSGNTAKANWTLVQYLKYNVHIVGFQEGRRDNFAKIARIKEGDKYTNA